MCVKKEDVSGVGCLVSPRVFVYVACVCVSECFVVLWSARQGRNVQCSASILPSLMPKVK